MAWLTYWFKKIIEQTIKQTEKYKAFILAKDAIKKKR